MAEQENPKLDNRRIFALGLIIVLFPAGLFATLAAGSTGPTTQAGSGTTMINGNSFQNTTTVNFSPPFPITPSSIGFTITAIPGAFTQKIFWTTGLLDAPLSLNTPFLDVFAQHDKNYAACPCTDTVTVTPANKDEIIVVNTNAVDGLNTVSVSSITSSPALTFIKRNFVFGGSFVDFEQWTATSYVTSAITITVTFSDPSTTGLTTGIIAGVFGNVVGIGATQLCSCSTTSPITVANLTMFRQSSLLVGGVELSNLNTSCNDPTPAGNPLQTQVTNDNTFCHSNNAGAGTFPHNYDMEYVNMLDQPFYLYKTGFNGTTQLTNGGTVELFSGYNQSPSWTVTPAGTELLNSREYERSIGNPFQGQPLINGAHGTIGFTCSFATANVTISPNIDILGANTDPPTVIIHNAITAFSISTLSLCDGRLHQFNIQASFGINTNSLARVVATCSGCGTSVTLGMRDVTIDWTQVIQNIPSPIVTAKSATGFTVTWRMFYPAAINSIFTWDWRAEI